MQSIRTPFFTLTSRAATSKIESTGLAGGPGRNLARAEGRLMCLQQVKTGP